VRSASLKLMDNEAEKLKCIILEVRVKNGEIPVLTHLDEHGEAPRMVDVAGKAVTERSAHAQACLCFPPNVAAALREAAFMTKKGAVLTIAQIAGIMGVKATATLIPLCHPLSLSGCQVDIVMDGNEAIIDCHV